MINAVVIGDPRRISSNIRALFPETMQATGKSMARLVFALSNKIKFQKLSGQVLRNKTGVLRDSISPSVRADGNSIIGQVATNVEYARIHEYGGEIHHPGGTAYMFDKSSGRAIFVSNNSMWAHLLPRTAPHLIPMPERSFMRTALQEMEPDIRATFENALSEVVSKLGRA